MNAAIITGPGAIEIREVPLPEPAPHEVRVRVHTCGVCASNVPPWEGRPWFSYPMAPGALGHEACGTIDLVGADVPDWEVGTPVAVLSQHAFAEFDLATPDTMVRLPPSLAHSSFLGEPLGCAMNIFLRSGIRAGDRVAIVGVGFLGSLLVQLALGSGAEVVACARRAESLQLSQDLGAKSLCLTEDRGENIERAKELTDGQLFDVTIEATGKQEPLDLAAELTRERGRLVIAGYHQDGPRQINLQLWNWRGLDVINAHEREPRLYLEGIRAAIDAVLAGRIDPISLITHHFTLEGLHDALVLTRDRPDGFMKAVITL